MVDGALGDSESLAGLSEEFALEFALVKSSSPFGNELYVDIDQASEVTCPFSRVFQFVDSISTSCGNWGASSQSK